MGECPRPMHAWHRMPVPPSTEHHGPQSRGDQELASSCLRRGRMLPALEAQDSAPAVATQHLLCHCQTCVTPTITSLVIGFEINIGFGFWCSFNRASGIVCCPTCRGHDYRRHADLLHECVQRSRGGNARIAGASAGASMEGREQMQGLWGRQHLRAWKGEVQLQSSSDGL